MKARFLLIAFDTTKPPEIGQAMRTFIKEAQFKALEEDYNNSIWLDEKQYTITAKRPFRHDQLEGVVIIMVIDIKPIQNG